MKTRALIAAFALSAIVLGSGVSAFAYSGYCNNSDRGAISSLSPEKQSAYQAMMKEHFDRISPLRDKLDAKRIELNALSSNPNAKPETLSKLAGEVAELQAQLRTERRALGDRMEKDLGIRHGYGMGHGMGGMMDGRGYHGGRHGGHGGHGGNGGYGPNC